MIVRAERDADEGEAAFDRDRSHRSERAVASGHADRVRFGRPSLLGGIFAGLEYVRPDPEAHRLRADRVGGRRSARLRIDEENPRHPGPAYRPVGPVKLGRSAHVNVRSEGDHRHMEKRDWHRIEEDLSDGWFEKWASDGLRELEAYLAKYAAFFSFLAAREAA